MKKNSLTVNSGLSLSQAQSISNLCNQRAVEITNKITGLNNYSKSVNVSGKEYVTIKGKPVPSDLITLVKEKAELHACQAFLMENIKAKDRLLQDAKNEVFNGSDIEFPIMDQADYIDPIVIKQVDENFGWEQLTISEYNEYLEAESFASHVGQAFHKGSDLDKLRNELPNIPAIEWMTINDGTKSPVEIKTHHKSEDLHKIHEELATIHRGYEQRVNYFKAKVKNITTEENARIAKINADAQIEAEKINNERRSVYETKYKKAIEELKTGKSIFEKTRQEKIKEIASMRINIDQLFQKTINLFLDKLDKTKQE